MKKLLRAITVAFAVLFALGMFGCGREPYMPMTKQPGSDKTQINVFKSSYITNASLTAKEIYIRNDLSGWVRYSLSRSDSAEKIKTDMTELVKNINLQRYSEATYDKGYRVFYMQEGDIFVSETERFVTIRFTNLTYCHDYYSNQTVGEAISGSNANEMKYMTFYDVEENLDKNGEHVKNVLLDTSEKNQKSLKIWRLKQVEKDVKVRIEGKMLYFHDGDKKTIETSEGGYVFSNEDDFYFIYNEYVLNVMPIVVGVIAGVLVLGAAALVFFTVRRNKKDSK